MIEGQLRQGACQSDHSGSWKQHGSEESSKEKTAVGQRPRLPLRIRSPPLVGSVINMGVTAMTSGSVLLCLFAAKRLI
jgi:hypothetical protein